MVSGPNLISSWVSVVMASFLPIVVKSLYYRGSSNAVKSFYQNHNPPSRWGRP